MAKEPKQISFLDDILEKYGSDIIETEESAEDVKKLHVVHTGSVALDISLGVKGIPLGRLTSIYGPESSAKTSLCLTIAKNAIESDLKVLYVDVEQGVDYNYITAIIGEGYDKSKLVIVKPETAEQALGICEKGINSGEFNIVILDSVAALAPEKEKEDELTKAHIGLIPRLLSAFLRRNMYSIRTKNVGVIFVNQVRADIGSYIANLEMPGGHALRHFSSIILMLFRGEKIEQNEKIVGSKSRFIVKKNKLSAPFRGYTFPLIYGKGIDTTRDLVDFAEMLGILEKRGSYYVYEGETIAQGLVKTVEVLNDNKELLDKIKEKVYNSN